MPTTCFLESVAGWERCHESVIDRPGRLPVTARTKPYVIDRKSCSVGFSAMGFARNTLDKYPMLQRTAASILYLNEHEQLLREGVGSIRLRPRVAILYRVWYGSEARLCGRVVDSVIQSATSFEFEQIFHT